MQIYLLLHLLMGHCIQRAIALCNEPLLIDDFSGWLTKANSLNLRASDDNTMTSISASAGTLSFVPKSTSYFYEKLPCKSYPDDGLKSIQFVIDAPVGSSFNLEIQTVTGCGQMKYTSEYVQLSGFKGGNELLSIPLSAYEHSNVNAITAFAWGSFSNTTAPWKLAWVNFGCNVTTMSSTFTALSTIVTPSSSTSISSSGSSAASSATSKSHISSSTIIPNPPHTSISIATSFSTPTSSAIVSARAVPTTSIIDTFASPSTNAAGHWHGADDGMSLTWGFNSLSIKSPDSDYSFYTQFSDSCVSLASYASAYLHITYSGTTAFTIALQQHNAACSEEVAPFPETWDSVEAGRYANGSDIYVPLSHFNIDITRVIGVALKGFYKPSESLKLTRIELVPSIPTSFKVPAKLPSGSLLFHCKRPNSFAFGIDDGEPKFAQAVLKVLEEEGVHATFFTVGQPLLDPNTNLSNVYRDALARGHQVALHSFMHPKMEGLPSTAAIDEEYSQDVAAMSSSFNGLTSTYFRPPYGTEGARMRQRLAAVLGMDNPSIVMWSVDAEDWLWGESSTPEKQLEAFKRDVAKGGNLVVTHYLYQSTVDYLREFVRVAKGTGKRIMRVDQCMMDPNAPPLD